MRKYLPVLVMMILLFSFVTVVSATDINETTEMTDSTTISQDDSIVIEDTVKSPTKVDKSTKKEEKETYGDDCCSAIIQGYNNDSTISFRRDSTAAVTLNVTHNSTYITQCKGSGTYFCHVLISNTGWLVGSGGTDSPETSRGIQKNAISIIENNNLTNASFNKIINLKKNTAKGHVVIKAPNGTYALFIINSGKTLQKTGVLQPGEFLSVPNDPKYFVTGKYQNYTKSSYFILSSKLIAAMDKYGVERRNIMTYYYKRTNLTSTVKIYASNDDGRYVKRSTKKYVDSVRTNTNFISSSKIPTLEGWANIDEVKFNIKAKTFVTSKIVTTNKQSVKLTANVKDEFGNPVTGGKVSLIVNGKTVKYANGSVKYANVKNGVASITCTTPNMFKATSYPYYFRYYGNSKYYSKIGDTSQLKINDVTTMKVTHAKTVEYGGTLTITANVNYSSNKTSINGGQVLFKINGKTIKNSDGSTYTVKVKNGIAKYKLALGTSYSAKTYNISVVYANGVRRNEKVSNFTVKKIATKINSPKVTVTNNTVKVKASLVNSNNKKITYSSYVSVKINGITLKDSKNKTRTFKVNNGTISFSFKLPTTYKKGNHTLTIVVPELKETLSVRKDVVMTIK